MACAACRAEPTTHSFEPLTRHGTCHVFYTSFKHTKDYSNATAIINHIKGELMRVDLSGGWGWILDCQHMAMKHVLQMQVSIGIIRFLQSEFNGTLQFLYIVNGGAVMATALKACYPFLSKGFVQRIHYLNGRPLELLDTLTGMVWKREDLAPLMGRLQKEYAA
jgi:hypothetical protein